MSKVTWIGMVLITVGLVSHAVAFEVDVYDDYGFNATDSTSYIQAAINSGATKVTIPNIGQTWISGPLSLASNQELFLESGVLLMAKSGAFGTYDSFLTADKKSTVSISGYGAEIRMRKGEYGSSQWVHGIKFNSVSTGSVEGVKVRLTGGDGIYLGVAGGTKYNRNIVIDGVICDDCKRNGISVISAENLTITDCVLSDSEGQNPEAGIDIEPNYDNERLVNVLLKDTDIYRNKGAGVQLWLAQLSTASQYVDITIDNVWVVSSGTSSFYFASCKDNVDGLVTVKNCGFFGAEGPTGLILNKAGSGVQVKFDNTSFRRSDDAGYPFVFRLNNLTYTSSIGGVNFTNNSFIRNYHNEAFMYYDDAVSGTHALSNITGNVDVENPYGVLWNLSGVSLDPDWLWTPLVENDFESDEAMYAGSIEGQDGWTTPFGVGSNNTALVMTQSSYTPPAASGTRLLRLRRKATATNLRAAKSFGFDAMTRPFEVSAAMGYNNMTNYNVQIMLLTDGESNWGGVQYGFRKRDGVVRFAYRDGSGFHSFGSYPSEKTFYRFISTVYPSSGTYSVRVYSNGYLVAEALNKQAISGVTEYQYVAPTIMASGPADDQQFFIDDLTIDWNGQY